MWQTRGAEGRVSPLEPAAPLLVCVSVGVSVYEGVYVCTHM